MTEPVVTGTDVIRQAVKAKRPNTAVLARELGLSNETLLSFCEGRVQLKPETLQALNK